MKKLLINIDLKTLKIIFAIKLLSFLFLLYINKSDNPNTFYGMAQYYGDSGSYLKPIEAFITTGKYTFESSNPTLYRSPFYGIFYYCFRLIFNPYLAMQAMVIFQLIFEIIAFYFFTLLSFKFLKERFAKISFFVLLGISLFHTDYSFRLLTESLSLSFLLISFYTFYLFIQNQKTKYLIFTGIFFALVVLLKHYFGLYYLIFGISILMIYKDEKGWLYLKKIGISSLILFLPFMAMDLPWLIRNYKTFGIIQPFNDYGFNELTYSYRHFVKARGETYVYWDHVSAGCYFELTNEPCNFEIKEYFISKNSSLQETESIRNKYLEYQKSEIKSPIVAQNLAKEFDRLTNNYKKDKPINYYFLSRARIMNNFVINSGSYFLPYKFSNVNLILKLIKISQSLLYYLCLFIGFIGLCILTRKYPKHFYIFSIPLFLILFFPIIYGASEWRYFFHFYPIALFGVIYFFEWVIFKKKKEPTVIDDSANSKNKKHN